MTVCRLYEGPVNQFIPNLRLTSTERDGEKTLVLDFDRFATNGELTWFLSEFGNHRFIMKECSVSAEKKIDEHTLVFYKTRDGAIVKDLPDLLPKKFRVSVAITFYEHIKGADEIPEFVRLFSGLEEGELPEMPKPMSVWERLRAPLV